MTDQSDKPESTSVEAAVRAELRRLKATTGVEGRAAVKLARQLDEAATRDAPIVSRELRIIMAEIRADSAAVAVDPVDELRAKRRDRRRSS